MLRPWKLDLKINEKFSHLPVYKQIAETIIEAIESGVLKTGDVLPGTRKLASLFNVNRNTIIEAYSYLERERWLISRQRAGTFVAGRLAKSEIEKYPVIHSNSETNKIIFDQGLPDSSHSPILDIIREYRLIAKKIQKRKLHLDNDPMGYKKLRIILSQMLNQERRMKVDEDNICITRGSQIGIFLIAQCLLRDDDCIIVEHPGYRPAWDAFKYAEASVLLAEVDKDGVLISDIKGYIDMGKKIKAVYISPNSQFPTTTILSDSRRRELIDLSNQHDFFVIEDDYCIDLNYSDKHLLPLCSENNLRNYIYIGTFSRSISPLLKISYLVSNHDLVKKIVALRKIVDISGDSVMEIAFYHLIQDGTFSRHIKKYAAFYKEKRDFVDTLLVKYFKDKIIYTKPELGLGYWIIPQKPIDNYDLFTKELDAKNIKIINFNYYKLEGPGFFLSFGSATEKKLEQGIKILADYL
ncbi:aminotransferase-like domain-containing protein [Chryseobacterium tongliaoense]|uniref:aminotransferase-like domain-containing protein n=1 Tax=Chryseobacterium tongliaoense TaxID=3240933 RepID=UPI00351802F0